MATVDGCEILHQWIDGKHPTIYRVSTILLVVLVPNSDQPTVME